MSAFAPRRNLAEDVSLHGGSHAASLRAWRLRAAQRSRMAWWRWIVLLAVVVIVAAMQTGCASSTAGASGSSANLREYNYESPTGRPTAERFSTDAPGGSKMDARIAGSDATGSSATGSSVAFHAPDDAAADVGTASPEAQRLAAQSQRDVEMLLARSNATTPVSNTLATPEQAPNPSPTLTPARREIEWNDPTAQPAKIAHPEALPQESLPVVSVEPPIDAVPTTQPDAATLRPDRIRQLTVELARELYAAGAYSEHPLRELTVIAAMGMTEPERKLDPAAIPDLTDDERMLLANLQTFFTSIGGTLERGSDLNAGVAQAAAALRQSLVHEPELNLPTLALCTRVGGFGDYAPFDRNTFVAGTEQKAIVYIEIEDFVSEINQNNEFVTELSQQLTIFSEREGIPVWHEDWQQATDVTRNKRQDFFTTQIITLPKALSVGRYTLKVRVRDEKSKAESEASIPFELVADARMIK